MSLRRSGLVAVVTAVLAAGCTESVDQDAPPDVVVIATFSDAVVPLPNDLALQAVPGLPDGAQKELLQAFIDAGGFPSDQEVPITVTLLTRTRQADGTYADTAPPEGVVESSVNASTVAIVKIAPPEVEVIAPEFGGYDAATGVLTIRRAPKADGSRRWDAGARYVVGVRGGARGIKTSEGRSIGADLPIVFIAPNKDLTNPENLPLVGGVTQEQVQELEQLRALYANPLDWAGVDVDQNGTLEWIPCVPGVVDQECEPVPTTPFDGIDLVFPHDQLATIQTFGAAPGVFPVVDSGSGQVPLPSDFLLDPATGLVRFLPDSFGPAATGLATLDGFSTTGMLLAPLTGAVNASTITGDSVLVFELSESDPPRRLVDVAAALDNDPADAEYLTQPPQLNQASGEASAIGLQPAVPVPIPGTDTILYLPPLEERTQYAVVITDRVTTTDGEPLKRSTIATLAYFLENPLVDGEDRSTIPSISDADALALSTLGEGLGPLVQNIGAFSGDPGLSADNVVMAYPVTTQTVTEPSVLLSAAPFDPNADGDPSDSALFRMGNADPFDVTTVGLDPVFFPSTDLYTTTLTTLDTINPATGAINPDPSLWAPAPIRVLIAAPKEPPPDCDVPCALPLVIWHHGINGGRLQMLTAAESLVAKGFVVAAIDAPYHGDRAFCELDSECTSGICTPDQNRAGQGDAVPPGTCANDERSPSDTLTTLASGNYFVSTNFFRTRDAIRQDLFDHSALALAFAPLVPDLNPEGVAATLLASGIVIDATEIYLQGVSLGGAAGTEIFATNPRFSRGVLSMTGGTLVDIVTTAPAFQEEVDQLFLSLGIDRSQIATDPLVASRYLQTLIVAKWILDPAEPLNYAQYVTDKLESPLSALPGGLASETTAVFGQLAQCDEVIPNATTAAVPPGSLAYGDLLLARAGLLATNTTLYETAGGGCVRHAVLGDTFFPDSIGGQAREDAAEFLLNLTLPGTPVTLPSEAQVSLLPTAR